MHHTRSFESFLSLVKSQIEAPFLARYLKRDDTAKAITDCNDSLMRALSLFTVGLALSLLNSNSESDQDDCANPHISSRLCKYARCYRHAEFLRRDEFTYDPWPSSTTWSIETRL